MNIESTNASNLHEARNGRSAICYAHLYHADCFDIMPKIESKSIDLILADLPYGTTACKWDSVLPLDKLWNEYKRIIKDNGAIVLTASQPFTSILVLSNLENFKCEWIWEKNAGSNFANMKYQPMKEHESVLVFGLNSVLYNPIMEQRSKGGLERVKSGIMTFSANKNEDYVYGDFKKETFKKQVNELRFPRSIQKFNRERGLHPTQKPVELLKYLIKTYTNKGMTILDNTMGSGSTGVAAKMLQRNFIGIEKELNYFDIAQKRIDNTIIETSIFDCA
jgi:site-specific DNA-methyltransferase (adenine-specific)